MIPAEWIDQAVQRTGQYLQPTPLHYDRERQLYLKCENQQTTGSFKIRGALNKVLGLPEWERQRGLVTASAGNHGQGLAWAALLVGARVTVFSSEHAVATKLQAMTDLGARVMTVPGGYGQAEAAGIHYARDHGATWVSPYNDGAIIAGQATLAVEALRQLDGMPMAAWVVPVGGGGLLAGIGSVLHALDPKPTLYGVQSEASPYFAELFHRGSQEGVVEAESLADGLSGAVEAGSHTIPMVRNLAEDVITVSEDQIAAAIAFAWHTYGETIEGSAAVSLAAALNGHIHERPALLVLTGGNIQTEAHRALIGRYAAKQGWSP